MSEDDHKFDWLGIRTLIRNRQLLMQLLRRQLSQEHKGTIVGKAWLVIKPVLLLALYVFVFGYVFEGKFTDDENESQATYALGVFLGLTIIHFIADILAMSPRCISDNQAMVKRVKLPLEVIPASITFSALVHFAITLGLALAGLFLFGHYPTWQTLWLVPISLLLAIGGFGLSYLFATIGVYLRDITQVTPVLSMGLLFASAVFYPIDKIPEPAWLVLKYNPLLLAVEGVRKSALWSEHISLNLAALYFCIACITLYLVGFYSFQRSKSHFADLI